MFIIAMYGVMNYSLLMPNLIALYAKLNEIYMKNEFYFDVGSFFQYIIKLSVISKMLLRGGGLDGDFPSLKHIP